MSGEGRSELRRRTRTGTSGTHKPQFKVEDGKVYEADAYGNVRDQTPEPVVSE
jgi:hypothetical protein